MARQVCRLTLLFTLAGFAQGCAMCSAPYDECGSTFTGGCGDQCGYPEQRAGSILSGYSEAVPTSATIGAQSDGQPIQEPYYEEVAPGDYPSSPIQAPGPMGWHPTDGFYYR